MKIGYLMQAGVPDIREYPLTGPSNHVREVFIELRNLGHQVTILFYLDHQIWKSDDLEIFEAVNVPWLDQNPYCLFERAVRRFQYEFQLPYAALFESLRFAKACHKELANCDIFYERMGWMGYGGGLASKWMNVPLVLEVNGDHLSELEMLGMKPKGIQRWISIILMKGAVRRSSHVVATGEGWRQCFIKQWGVNLAKVSVVENGTATVKLLQREQLRCFQTIDAPIESVNLIYVGGFEPWHGLEILIHAIDKVINQGISLHLTLIGTGSLLNKIEQLIHEYHIEPLITLTGPLSINQTVELLTNSDIGLSPYCGRVEYSGLKLLDYKSAGLAIIASGENGQPSVIEHGQTGWIVPPCDKDALSEAIIYLATNTNLRRKIGQAARIEAENRHSWHHTALELEKIFFEVLAK